MCVKHFFSAICFSSVVFATGAICQEAKRQCLYDFEADRQGWVVESHSSTRGALSAERSNLKFSSGNYSLKVRLNLAKLPDSLSKGEIRVDLRSFAPGDQLGPLDLSGRIVKVKVWFPIEFEGEANSPNGVQLFAKSAHTDSRGQEQTRSLYGIWVDAAGQSGDWLEMKLLISDRPSDGIRVESGFDPKSIRYLGVKFGIGGNTSSKCKFLGDVFVDCVSW